MTILIREWPMAGQYRASEIEKETKLSYYYGGGIRISKNDRSIVAVFDTMEEAEKVIAKAVKEWGPVIDSAADRARTAYDDKRAALKAQCALIAGAALK